MERSFALNPVALGLHNNVLYEPQRTNHFEVYIFIPQILYNGDAEKTEAARKYITLATESFSVPGIQVQEVTIPYGNTNIKLAGTAQITGANSLTCQDYIGADVEGIIYAWQNLVYNPETSQIGWAYNYKTDAKVLEYSGDGECLASWVLRGVWPSNVQYGNGLAKNNGGIKKISVTLAYDLAYRKFGDSTRNTAQAAAANAQANMNWKAQDGYAESNAGGPITPATDEL